MNKIISILVCTFLMTIIIQTNLIVATKNRIEDDKNQNLVYESQINDDYYTLKETYSVRVRYEDLLTMKTWSGGPKELTTYFAVPPDLNNQIIIKPIQYYPIDGYGRSFTDNWGNVVAHYSRMVSSDEVDTSFYEVEAILSKIEFNINPAFVSDDIPEDITNKYLIDEDMYNIYHAEVQNAIVEAVGAETNLYYMAKKIHDYIILNLEYSMSGGWDSAPVVLRRGDGSCSEFSFVLIAMCRAAGIPARYIGGTVLGGSGGPQPIPHYDTAFHRWTQIYIPPYGWIPVDVTWDNSIGGENVITDKYFGVTDNYLLVTTIAGAESNVFGWSYNCVESTGSIIQDIERTGKWFEYNRLSPNIPNEPTGTTEGSPFTSYDYSTFTTDPNGDDIYYWFDWGDGTNSGWQGPYPSGVECIVSHSYLSSDMFWIKVKAKNNNDYETDWSDPLKVSMPKTRIYNLIIEPLLRLLERFPIFEKILY